MAIEQIASTTFRTSDGRVFLTHREAAAWGSCVITYTVRHCPDLCEGRGRQKKSLIKVNSRPGIGQHQAAQMFAEYVAYKIFGNKVEFVQGVFGSNAITANWTLTEGVCEFPYMEIFVEDRFVGRDSEIMGEGIWVDRKDGEGFVKQTFDK